MNSLFRSFRYLLYWDSQSLLREFNAGFDLREKKDNLMPESGYFLGKASFELAKGYFYLFIWRGLDDVVYGFSLENVDSSAKKGPKSELSGYFEKLV